MIISFSLENWMSFRQRVTFSMVASREQQHGERVAKLDKYKTKILPIAAIYGGNASGKTNFFKALSFAKSLVVKGIPIDGLIPVEPFLLDADSTKQPTRFAFELLIDDLIYEFSFAVTKKAVVEEKLVLITSRSEKILYERYAGKATFEESLAKKLPLEIIFNGTRDNQLFLTNSVSQKIEAFKPVYDWFKDTLQLIAPDSRFEPFEQFFDEEHPLYNTMSAMLPQLDTGIAHLGGENIPFEHLPLSEAWKIRLQEELKEGGGFALEIKTSRSQPDHFVITRKNGELSAKKLVAYHPKSDGTEVKFEMGQESDGSRRVIDLLPAFLNLSERDSKRVYLIDEVDRSLHTLLTRQLIESYLSSCSFATRSQLLLTTHDVLLMDQQLLRRDEMWVAERDDSGASTLFSFSEYKDIRYDKDIRKSYLLGRLGGIPRILLSKSLRQSSPVEPSSHEE
ncbi:AAA family ATPase [Candidatus Electronema sp. PJ]|uniref:AAA family ATPase n=1 Tax=Candidatus Electronema sp. PJ TaxID=3401572 RepID=UPI003AA9095A